MSYVLTEWSLEAEAKVKGEDLTILLRAEIHRLGNEEFLHLEVYVNVNYAG